MIITPNFSQTVKKFLGRGIITSLLLSGASLSAPSWAEGTNPLIQEKDIHISSKFSETIPIAIANFTFQGTSNKPKFESVIMADLNNSGIFTSIAPQGFPQNIEQEPIDARRWVTAGIFYLVSGQITEDANSYTLNYQLYDLEGGRCNTGKIETPCFSKSIKLPKGKERELAHRAAAEVFFKFNPGVSSNFTTKIAYVRQPIPGISNYELYVADYDGYNSRLVYKSNRPIKSPAWYPDNQSLAFVRYGTFTSEIDRVDLNTGNISRVVYDPSNNISYSSPAIGNNGRMLFVESRYGNDSKICSVSSNGGSDKVCTPSNQLGLSEPSWLDASHFLATVITNRGPAIYRFPANSNSGEETIRVSTTSGPTTDGKFIAPNLLAMINRDRLTIQNLSSGEAKSISSTYLDESITVSPNGMMIIYSSTNGNRKVLNLTTVNGKYRINLNPNSGSISYPAWSWQD